MALGRTAVEVATSLETLIHAGRLQPGAILPTVRELAASLKVSPATVAAAYRLLRARGLTAGEGRLGTRVTARGALPPRPARSREAVPEGLVDLASGNPDPALLPPLGAALRLVPDDPALYGDPAEVRGLVTFAKGEFAADGIAVNSVIVASGALDAIERVLREHLRPGDRVVVEDPCYPALRDLLAVSGLRPEPVTIDAEGPRPDSLESALGHRPAAIILTPRAQNPTGAAITAARATDLRHVLKRHEGPLLIENDPCGPVAGVSPITLTEGRQHWAIVRSTSKFLGPDLRVALLAADDTTIARVRGRQAAGPRWVSRLLQHLALSLWSDPSSGRHLARAAATYAQRRTALADALAGHGLPSAAVSGINVWIPVEHEAAVVQRMADRGWAVAAGERFRLRSDPAIRITTSALEPDAAPRLASDLAASVREGLPALG